MPAARSWCRGDGSGDGRGRVRRRATGGGWVNAHLSSAAFSQLQHVFDELDAVRGAAPQLGARDAAVLAAARVARVLPRVPVGVL